MSQALEWLRLGGPAMLILLGLSIASVTLILVKAWEFWELKIGQRDFVAGVLSAWHGGRADEAIALLSAQVTPLAKVMAAAIKGRNNTALPEAEVREQITQLASEQLESARRLLRPLEVIANLAPLLGLLGTVLGMIQVFQRLQTAGDRVNPSILSGGLWEALLTTAAGLTVAIIALAGFHVLDRAVERLHHDMEGALTRIFTRPL
ncbi:MotA/TolQ/ExbB proton channel family protein [Stenotrophobium rhamnosiphilum]|uniref:Flagellar motor protein MotA n=1 Tax=Stenotrophobium rhamnosiphilum TaxID=2029166 RepID=A0A2T5MJ97_9GAMM|nr:MotA/TolQ/ExbB proton channel family protein [Stenotrophobium rhamnosiphilum]PTU32642.1 flagellar motor protein MotA [Stenotrophobium rhamnosiphilum]